jgi:PelA/Pel-15E family pectate lyase
MTNRRAPIVKQSFLFAAACLLVVGCSSGETPDASVGGSAGMTNSGGTGALAGAAGSTTVGGSSGQGGASGQAGSSPGVGGASGGTPTAGGASGAGGLPAAGGTSAGGSAGTTGGEAGAGGTGGTGSVGGAGGTSAGTGGSTAGAGGDLGGAGGSGGNDGAPILDQTGNPIYDQLTSYEEWLSSDSADRTLADNLLSWQMPHGGFYKNAVSVYSVPWNGSAARSGWTGAGGVELGTIDNNATVTELMFLADVYRRSGEAKYRDGARKALEFLLTMQYPSGGFPQVYPERVGSYSNHVTFNDNAMARVLILLHQLVQQASPLGGELFTDDQRTRAAAAITSAVQYILSSQITQGGTKTVWCAQHDPESFAPLGARSYELASKSGSESVGVITFLMTQPQTPEIEAAVRAAIAWYKSPDVQLENTAYVSRPSGNIDDNYNPIQSRSGSTMWCRFYDVNQDTCFFSGRLPTDDPPGEGKQYDIMDIEPERRYGYQWGGAYGTRLFAYTDSVGY